MKIVFFDIRPEDKDYFRKKLPDDQLTFFTESLSVGHLEKIKDAEVLSIRERSKVKSELTKQMPNLKLISTRTTGFDHVEAECHKSENVIVCNVPAYGQVTVAEYAFALILTLSRKIQSSLVKKAGVIFPERDIEGFDLNGKTIGIIGTGKIGSNVARIAKGFEMNVLGYDFYQNENVVKQYGLKYVELEELLQKSDVISLHLPSTPETFHLLNQKNMKHIKPGAILVNTARGELIENAALLVALNVGIISSAGLDVIQGEGLIFRKTDPSQSTELDKETQELLIHPNVIITPHNAFNTAEAYQRILDCSIENILAFKSNNLVNVVG